ncbi:MAG TPA: hypothetical protein VHM25_17560, partial [Polyangiaceae bacterium]|nr:hypothetical protein [Polyangiaceae bacterium]
MIAACGGCGAQFETLQGKYAPDGTIVCVACGERLAAQVKAVEKKASGSAFVGAFASVLIALTSFVVEHRFLFFLFPLIAIGVGAGTAYTALRNDDARATLGWKRIPTVIVGVLGCLL